MKRMNRSHRQIEREGETGKKVGEKNISKFKHGFLESVMFLGVFFVQLSSKRLILITRRPFLFVCFVLFSISVVEEE